MAEGFVKLTVTSAANPFHSDRTFSLSTNVQELKCKLELLTGVPASQMQLELRSAEGKFLSTVPNSGANSLASMNVQSGMILHVLGSADVALEGNEDGVEKFVISDEDYQKRADSVRAWKQKQHFGEYNPEYQKQKQREQEKLDSEAEQLAASIKVGQRCAVRMPSHPQRLGTVEFVGRTDFKAGHWVGVRYDEPVGKHDGCVDGRRYFQCPDNYGSFVRPKDVVVGDFPAENVSPEMDEF